jgi:hypothetical protein
MPTAADAIVPGCTQYIPSSGFQPSRLDALPGCFALVMGVPSVWCQSLPPSPRRPREEFCSRDVHVRAKCCLQPTPPARLSGKCNANPTQILRGDSIRVGTRHGVCRSHSPCSPLHGRRRFAQVHKVVIVRSPAAIGVCRRMCGVVVCSSS